MWKGSLKTNVSINVVNEEIPICTTNFRHVQLLPCSAQSYTHVHCILCNLELRSLHKLRDYTNIALTFHTDLKRPQSICHHSNLIPFVNQVNTFFQRLVCRLSKTSSNWQVLTDRIRQVEEIEVLSSSGTPGPALNCLIYLKATMHLLANCYLHIIYSSYRYLLL